MISEHVVVLAGASKQFYHYGHRASSLQEAVLGILRNRPPIERSSGFDLQPTTFSISRGETVALVGGNGSGKSTLLRLMAGVYPPSEGSVDVRGQVVPVLELGASFQPELTGRENVELYAATLGMGHEAVARRMHEILIFSGKEAFADVPLKYFSSGMRSRLAFSVATHVDGDVLLLDEVLAVGDAAFRQQCLERLTRYHERGGTIIVVSHDSDTLLDLCTRGIWIHHGEIRADGALADVIAAYTGHRE